MTVIVVRTVTYVSRIKTRKLLTAYLASKLSRSYVVRVSDTGLRRLPVPVFPKRRKPNFAALFSHPLTYATMPNVVTLPILNAITIVEAPGFLIGPIASAYSPTIPAGSVISQNPAANLSVARGTTVFLTVSVGPQPSNTSTATSSAPFPPTYAITLQIGTPQRFSITLAGVSYQFTFKYLNVDQGGWVIDIADVNGNTIIGGIPLVTGANLFGQYGFLNFGGALWVQTLSSPDSVPTFDNLGADAIVWWVPNATA